MILQVSLRGHSWKRGSPERYQVPDQVCVKGDSFPVSTCTFLTFNIKPVSVRY